MAFNQDVKAILPKPTTYGPFLGHWLTSRSHKLLGLVTESTHGTKRLDLKDLTSTPIELPSNGEQRRIADVLDNLDESIAQHERTIAKLRLVKKGLAEDLLSGRCPIPETGR